MSTSIPVARYSYGVLCNSCNMGMRDLHYMYARSLRAAGPRAEGLLQVICITSSTLKICPNLQVSALPIYVTMNIHFDYGILLDVPCLFI